MSGFYFSLAFFRGMFHLSVKGVELQLICAFECFRIDLFKSDPVELALEDVDLLMKCSNTKSESLEKTGMK